MTPEAILAALGLDLATLNATREAAKVFNVLGHIATDWNSFQRLWASLPTKPFSLAPSIAYRLTQFWTSPGYYYRMLSPDVPIPMAFAAPAIRTERETLSEANYRYDVAITLNFPKTGDQQTFYVHVDTPVPMSQSRAFAEALDSLMEQFNMANYDFAEGDEYDYFTPSFEVAGFYRLGAR